MPHEGCVGWIYFHLGGFVLNLEVVHTNLNGFVPNLEETDNYLQVFAANLEGNNKRPEVFGSNLEVIAVNRGVIIKYLEVVVNFLEERLFIAQVSAQAMRGCCLSHIE